LTMFARNVVPDRGLPMMSSGDNVRWVGPLVDIGLMRTFRDDARCAPFLLFDGRSSAR